MSCSPVGSQMARCWRFSAAVRYFWQLQRDLAAAGCCALTSMLLRRCAVRVSEC